MARFNVPQQPKPRAYEIENFLGVDLTNAPNLVAVNRSPEAPNMIRDTVGKIKKRDGVSFVKNYSAKGSCTYQITTNAEDGDKVYIYNVRLAATTGTPTTNQFFIGSTIAETATNLAAAIEAAVSLSTGELVFESFDVTVDDDTITITEKTSGGRTPLEAGTEGTIVVVSGTPVVSKVTGINGVHILPPLPFDVVIPAGRMTGDCDGDGYFAGGDLDYLYAHYGEALGPTPSIEMQAADLVGDGQITSTDLSALLARLLNAYTYSSTTTRDLLEVWGTKYDLGITTTDWAYYVDIAVSGVKTGMVATLELEPDVVGQSYLDYIGVVPTVICGENTIRVYSKLLPIQAINAKLNVTTGSMRKIIHAGQVIYSDEATPVALYSTAADTFSKSEVMNDSLWILDGKAFLEYDGETCAAVTGYTPVIIIGRDPSGGGTLLEEINLIQDAKIVKFLGTVSDTVYYLPHTSITAVTLVQKMDGSGVMQTVSADDYTVDTTAGTVTFDTAPGVSPITGEDNVYITYTKSITGYSDRINKCDICTLYGVGGARDRLFVSGNPDYPHYDWFSAQNDPTYFGDLSYCVVGHASSAIMGYSIVNDYLVTHKTREENDENASLRAGEIVSGKAVFTIQGSYPASGALSKHAFAELGVEPVYLTVKKDISAITPSDLLGERYSQERSYYISEALKAEDDTDLANAFGYTFNDFYYLSVGSKVYILDSLQFSVDKNKPYSSRQYECYYFTGINARVMWQEDGYLYFGDLEGNIKKFDPEVANDEGVAIQAYWDTPELDGDSFAYRKTFTYIAVRMASAPATGIRISSRVRGLWDEWGTIKDYTAEAMYFDFTELDFAALSFSTDDTPRTIGTKIKIKNVDKVQFRLENNVLDQPFGLYKLRIEYFENGRYAK